MILDSVNKSLELILGSAVTTTAMPITVDYVDMTSTTTLAGSSDSQSNGVTMVTILAAPAASTQRKVNALTVYNADSASKVVTIRLNNNTVLRPLVVVTIQVGETLGYSDTGGWYVLTTGGNRKEGVSIAADIVNTPAGNIAATTVQAAINELDSEKSPLAGSASIVTTGALNAGSITSGFGAIDIGADRLTAGNVTTDGIKFPATQVSSADANTLDDYEEGTFTPVIEGNTTAGVGTYSVQIGRYTKIGRLVTFNLSIEWSAHTGTGNIKITGLPFTSMATSSEWTVVPEFSNMTIPASTIPFALIMNNSSFVRVYSQAVGTGTVTALAMDTAAGIYFSMTYEAA